MLALAALNCGGGSDQQPAGDEEPVPRLTVPPGTCGVSRRLWLDASLESSARVFRIGAGFWAGTSPAWESVSRDGRRQRVTRASVPDFRVQLVAPIGKDAFDARTVAFGFAPDQPHETPVIAAPVAAGSNVVEEPRVIMPGFDRGTLFMGVTPALANDRAVVVHGHVGTLAARAAVVGPDAVRVGEPTVIAGEETFDNRAVLVPTAEAAAVATVDEREGVTALRLTELRADGSATPEVVLPFAPAPTTCPALATLSRSGFAVAVEASDGVRAYAIENGSSVELTEAVPVSALGAVPLWISRIEAGVRYFVNAGGRGQVVDVEGAQVTFIKSDIPFGVPIASEPGTLFLQVSEPQGSAILEIECVAET